MDDKLSTLNVNNDISASGAGVQHVNSGTAYLLWCLSLFGVCGIQRFYTGNYGSAIIYLFTFGFCYIGQVLDLALIPSIVEKRNIYLRASQGGSNPNQINQTVTLNIGDIPQLQQPYQQSLENIANSQMSSMQKLLKAAKENGGQLSTAQAAMATELEPEEVKTLLQEAVRVGYADVFNDPETGAIRYHFDV